jgi:hypothetical protein
MLRNWRNREGTVMRSFVSFVIVLALAAVGLKMAAFSSQAGGAGPGETEANRVVEITFTSVKEYNDPFNQVDLDVVFTAPDGHTVRVPAFWAGDSTWRVRYASPQVGVHTYRTECSDKTNKNLHGQEGKVKIVAYTGKNPLYHHGPLRVAKSGRYLEHQDGTPFLWLGDTWWMGLCQRLKWPGEFQTLAADRLAKGFNVIQIVAGLYPDMPAFDQRGANEAGFPWEKDYARMRPEYFDKADARLMYLADQGLMPCIVAAWGYHLPWLGEKKMKQHVRYLVARYGALPVVWCIAGEVNLPYYLDKGFPKGGEKQTARWKEVIQYARSINGFGRPVTVHPTGLPPLSGRGLYPEPGLLDFDMLQTGHGGKEVLVPTLKALRASYEAKPPMPVINAEVSYEALLGKIPADVPRLMCWACLLNGAAGHTYGANGIWQLNRPEQAYGPSPHGGDYGKIPWNEAMKLPGATQVGLAKKLLEEYPWHQFTPQPDSVAWAKPEPSPGGWGDWIWYPEGDPAKDAPVGACYFRKTFDLPPGQKVSKATLRLTVDDTFTAYLNGHELGSHGDWKTGKEFTGLAKWLKPGANVLAVRGENAPGPKGANPAGLNARLEIEFAGGKTQVILSDGSWLCTREAGTGWQDVAFDAQGWVKARVAAPYGQGPWGKLTPSQEYLVPFAAGVPGVVRVVYAPLPKAVVVRKLGQAKYTAVYFDPLTGQRTPAGPVQAGPDGAWEAAPPPNAKEDWVLVLESKAK